MEIRQVGTDELSSMHGNDFDDYDEHRVERLVDSMESQGYDDYHAMLVVGDDYRVANGRHRTIAARRVGLDEVTVLHVTECEFDDLRDACGDDFEQMTEAAFFRLEG